MQISRQQIETVKQSNDIISIIKSKGIKLKKKGKNYIALCPFHAEDTPSFTVDPEKQLYHCFGCRDIGKGSTGGDVIGFVVKHDNVSFQEAMESLRLGVNSGVRNKEKTKKEKPPLKLKKTEPEKTTTSPAKKQKLLKRVVEFYQQTFTQDDKGLKYLTKTRKITDKSIFSAFTIGYANGSLLKTLPKDGELIDQLKDIGILNKKGNEMFYGSVTFPVYDCHGNITTIYGRKIKDQENNPVILAECTKNVQNKNF